MLLNKQRAYEIMDKYNLDGLLAVTPRNIYYLTDFSGFNNRTQRTFYEYAVLPRSEKAPAAYITTAVELPRLHDFPTWVPNVVAYTHPVTLSNRDYDTLTEDPDAGVPMNWPVRPGISLPPREKQWLELKKKYGENVASSPFNALRRALNDAGLVKGKIGTDDPRVLAWLNEMGMDGLQSFEATNVFREIRMIKSPEEIELLTKAAKINEESMNKVISVIKEGISWAEIEKIYFTEMTKKGGQGVYITAGSGGLPDESVIKGKPVMLDSLGSYKLYLGDLGRTVVVGEASKEIIQRNKAMMAGWETAIEMIKPGVLGRDLAESVINVIEKEGFPGFLIVTPHSIGLEHTDHPLPIGMESPGSKGDFIFHENMVVNIDMPYHEYGWGSMHLEDTLIITKDGNKAITSQSTELFVVD